MHFASGGQDNDDAEWYALRNAVFAAGCKTSLSEESSREAIETLQFMSWQYFENAMSVHTDLIYMRSGLMAIQALLAMVSANCIF